MFRKSLCPGLLSLTGPLDSHRDCQILQTVNEISVPLDTESRGTATDGGDEI